MAKNVTEMTAQISDYVNHWVDYFEFINVENTFLKAFLVFLIFFLLAFVIRTFFVKILARLVSKTETDIDDLILNTVKVPVLLIIVILGLFLSGLILNVQSYLGAFYTNLFLTLESFISFILVFDITRIIASGIRGSLKSRAIKIFDNKIWPFFERSIVLVLIVAYLFIFFAIWSINLTPLLASAGVLGLAIAFAAKDTIANIFGGISIFFDKSYEIEDYIIVDNKDRGEVIDIGFRSTKLKTRDDVLITIPNSIMATSKVVNESGVIPKLRVRVDMEVSCDSDLEKVEKVLLDIAKREDYVEKKPEPRVRFRNFKDFGIHVQLSIWVKRPALRGRHKSYIIKAIHKRFNKEGIEMPYPTSDIYIKSMPKGKK